MDIYIWKENCLKLKLRERHTRYTNDKKRFFGLVFQQKELSISVIEKVKDFMQKGDDLRHCVFTNEYYEKKICLSFRLRSQTSLSKPSKYRSAEWKFSNAGVLKINPPNITSRSCA